jgi:hypothetical protein
MLDREKFRKIASARLKTVDALIGVGDWDMAGYMLGHVLECALKASVCKTLKIAKYFFTDKKDNDYFLTHRFDRLLILSGMQDLFGPNKIGYYVWSEFTKKYPGEWVTKRYEEGEFDETSIRLLRGYIVNGQVGNEGVLDYIKKKRRW